MRAQLRTYHAIPSLQARQDPNSYKQLQDAPRLKSILKGASEDQQEPTTIERIKTQPHPRTNPVNLIFVLCQYAPKMTEIHFDESVDFYDLVMRNTITCCKFYCDIAVSNDLKVSYNILCHVFEKKDYHCHATQKKLLLSQNQKNKCLKFAQFMTL